MGVIEFTENEKFSLRCDPRYMNERLEVRRIAPQFESQGWKRVVSTSWKWYWKDVNDQYVEYGQQVRLTQGNLKGEIGSVFDSCVNATGGGHIAFHVWR